MNIRTHLKAGDQVHIVRPGDNLSYIAYWYYGPTIDAKAAADYIYAFNKSVIGNNPNIIYPGQHITIPEPPMVVGKPPYMM